MREGAQGAKLLENRQNIVFAEQQHFIVTQLDIRAGIGVKDDSISLGNLRSNSSSIREEATVPHGEDPPLQGGGASAIGKDDAASGRLFGIHAFDNYLIAEWLEFHCQGFPFFMKEHSPVADSFR